MISELTEITETERAPFRGWIFYDRDCAPCRNLALRLKNAFARRGFFFTPLQERWVQERLNLSETEAMEEMRVLTAAGKIFGGADAIVYLTGQLWWSAPVRCLARIPGFHATLDHAYRWIAAHRSCALAAGSRPSPARWTRWLPLAILSIGALIAKPFLPAWGFMWLMGIAIFAGCKWLTLGMAVERAGSVCRFRAAAYLFAWPGMDAPRFLSEKLAARFPHPALLRETGLTLGRSILGILLLFVVARHVKAPLLTGWIGMFGMILVLHFGLFHLASVAWRAARVDAPPLMNAPLRSRSISEFWSRRWNGAFNDLALRLVFRPMVRVAGTNAATLTAFLVSGLIHELVISLPAGAGFGLPTGYFLAQGLGILLQRRGWMCGRFFTLVTVGGPVFWLFHPAFVRQVILPFMEAIGAL